MSRVEVILGAGLVVAATLSPVHLPRQEFQATQGRFSLHSYGNPGKLRFTPSVGTTVLTADEPQRPADQKDIAMARLAELAQLRDGWLGAGSFKPSEWALAETRRLLGAVREVPKGLEPAPLEDGGIRLEWTIKGTDFIAELESNGGMYLCKLPVDADDDQDYQSPQYDASLMQRFVESGVL